MLNNPLVSIITVTFNSEKTIKDTIESVLEQNYKNIEYIIIDGKSTDKTLEIVKSYESQFGGRLYYISEPDNGIYHAMNKGIKKAKGELIGIINSDDWYEEDAVENAVSAYNSNVNAVIYGILRMYKNDKLYFLKSYTHHFLSEQMIQHPTCFVPKKIYERYGMFDESFKVSADFEFMNRIKSKNVNFIQLEKVMANFRMGGISSNNIGPKESLEIMYDYGHITRKTYLFQKFKSFCINNIKKII